jgi:ABC-type dipeptide/oligopeptide/nickel transport system ATPase subunit
MENALSHATATVRAENVAYGHPGAQDPLLHQINVTIRPGKLIGLTGHSGIGKSTLSDILLGLLQPSQGQVYWNGRDISTEPIRQKIRLRRLYQKIFQDPAASFPPHQTVGQAMKDVISYYKMVANSQDLNMLLEEVLAPLGLDQKLLNRHPHQLSGGEMQRMALARIMLVRPRFIVADEPTSRLDLSVQAQVIRLLADLTRSQKWSVLLISHDSALIHAVCDHGLRLECTSKSQIGATLTEIF